MTASLACVMGFLMLGGDPMQPNAPLAPSDNAGAAYSFAGPGTPMFVGPPPAPAVPDGPMIVPPGYMTPGAAPAGQPDGVQFFSFDELKAEMKKLSWTKGDYTITPYGILWANLVEETGRTNPGNYPLYVARPREDANSDCYIDARSTRLGFDVLGPQVPMLWGAQVGGKVEIDFQRQIDTENKPSLLLRHAYVEVKDDDFRLLAGQTWDVISPLNPGVLFYSVGWDGGNIGYRRPQFRAERYLTVSDTVQVIAQGSLNTCSPTDTSGTATTYTAMSSSWPVLEGRIATRLGPRGDGLFPWEFGVSSHVGQLTYDFHKSAAGPFNFTDIGAPRETWSLNTDIRVPITQRFGVQGELFMGQNLGPFLGGVGQSVDVVSYTDSTGKVHYATGDGIRSRGGWVDAWYDWTPRLHTHSGYSVDDPFNNDVTSGRVYNGFCFANVSYDLAAKFLVGFEYSHWKTLWVGPSAVANSDNYNFVVKLGF